jgi:Kef-type K+ transport system membrane component KefB
MHPAVEALLPIALMLLAAKIAGLLSLRIGMPAVFGELLVGLALGPSLFNLVELDKTTKIIAEIGVVLLMFMAGMETDVKAMKTVGRPAFLTAFGGLVLPLAGGTATMLVFGGDIKTAVLVGAVLMATSVSISAQTLRELGLMRTREGTVILGAAIIDDVLGVLIFAVVMNLMLGTGDLAITLLSMVLFFPVAWFIADKAIPFLRRFEDRIAQKETVLAILVAIILFYAWSAEAFGSVAAIIGSYLLGVVVARHVDHHHVAHGGIAAVGYGIFIPIFFVSIGLQANINDVVGAPMLVIVLTVLAIITKLLGGALGARAGGINWRNSWLVGAGMISRGEVALVLAGVALSSGAIETPIFSALIVMAVVTTLVTPPLLRVLAPKQPETPADEASQI